MYAVMKTGGKQYRVSEGDILHVAKMPLEIGEAVNIEDVLLISDSEETLVGQPTVEGARIRVTVQSHGRGKKIIVYKHKKNYHKKQGHRQDYTRLHIDKILREGEEYEEPEEVVVTKEVEALSQEPSVEMENTEVLAEESSIETEEVVAESEEQAESNSAGEAPSVTEPTSDGDNEDSVTHEENKDGA